MSTPEESDTSRAIRNAIRVAIFEADVKAKTGNAMHERGAHGIARGYDRQVACLLDVAQRLNATLNALRGTTP